MDRFYLIVSTLFVLLFLVSTAGATPPPCTPQGPINPTGIMDTGESYPAGTYILWYAQRPEGDLNPQESIMSTWPGKRISFEMRAGNTYDIKFDTGAASISSRLGVPETVNPQTNALTTYTNWDAVAYAHCIAPEGGGGGDPEGGPTGGDATIVGNWTGGDSVCGNQLTIAEGYPQMGTFIIFKRGGKVIFKRMGNAPLPTHWQYLFEPSGKIGDGPFRYSAGETDYDLLKCTMLFDITGTALTNGVLEKPGVCDPNKRLTTTSLRFTGVVQNGPWEVNSGGGVVPGVISEIFKVNTLGSVENGPPSPTVFTLGKTTTITSIKTYHWNYGAGTPSPGEILIVDQNTQKVYKYQAEGESGSGGAPNAYWIAKPNLTLPPGRYEIRDSDEKTRSWNQETNGVGCLWVYGS